ncbi:MAG: translation initiation factor IF-2 N-terminal domain-containing protein, partial [Muribaculaceae bacterium]|nr:translation initiation factor IF-2 N-terminal domain-containing protein [Muribaculaceae bacterium]
MAKTKISKIAKDLNISVNTVIEFLRKRDINIEESPNTRVEEDIVNLLMGEFQSDKDLKKRSAQITTERKESRVKPAPAAPKAEEEAADSPRAPRILGKLELDANGNPIVRRPESSAATENQTPRAEAPVEKPQQAPAPKAAEAAPEVHEAPKAAPAPKAPEAPAPEAPKPAPAPAPAP